MKNTGWIVSFFVLSHSFAFGLDWEKEVVDTQGAKPAIDLNSKNEPIIAFMLESFSGFVKLAEKNDGGWNVDEVSTGYFYGPLDVKISEDDIPIINYHDHTTEDQTIASRTGGEWTVNNIAHPGHDGWDNNVAIDSNGDLHTLTTDPSGFGGEGLEFASRINGNWQVETVGTGPIMYAEGTDMVLDTNDQPHISYHNSNSGQLYYGTRDGILWTLTPVDESPDSGLFSSIALSSNGQPYISYIGHNENNETEVRLAQKTANGWEIETVDILEDLTIGFLFARDATCLVLDENDNPSIAYSDETKIKFAQKIDGEWKIEIVDTIENNEGARFGEQVDLVLDSAGGFHLTSFDVLSESPLYGNILYYKAQGTSGIKRWKTQ